MKYAFESIYERNGDTYLRAFIDGVIVGVVRDCGKRGDNFHAVTRRSKGRYFSTKIGAARYLAKQDRDTAHA